MGRRKFTYNSKPYGRNELISEYLWIAHIKSLAPGQLPDESKRRTRKQVSSHIQVLKTFLKSHPDGRFSASPWLGHCDFADIAQPIITLGAADELMRSKTPFEMIHV